MKKYKFKAKDFLDLAKSLEERQEPTITDLKAALLKYYDAPGQEGVTVRKVLQDALNRKKRK